MPTTRSEPKSARRAERVADADVPLAREAALDHDLADLAVAQVAAVDDQVAAAPAEHRGDRALARPVRRRTTTRWLSCSLR